MTERTRTPTSLAAALVLVVGGGLLALAAAAAGRHLGAAACWMDGAERLSAQTIDAPLAIYRRG